MELYDFPILAQAYSNVKVQRLQPDLPILERKMFLAKSIHEFAAAFLARWIVGGIKPEGEPTNAFQRAGIALAASVWEVMHDYRKWPNEPEIRKDLAELLKCQWRLTTTAYSGERGATFLESPPSNQARREAVARRKIDGSTHHLPKVRVKRERCGQFDARYPAHW